MNISPNSRHSAYNLADEFVWTYYDKKDPYFADYRQALVDFLLENIEFLDQEEEWSEDQIRVIDECCEQFKYSSHYRAVLRRRAEDEAWDEKLSTLVDEDGVLE